MENWRKNILYLYSKKFLKCCGHLKLEIRTNQFAYSSFFFLFNDE